MKTQTLFIISISLIISFNSAFALDKVCEQVLQAGEVRANQLAWHSTTEIKKDFIVHALKVNGQFYSKQNDSPWKKAATDFDAAARKFSEQARRGVIIMSECKDEGTQAIDGIDATVISYHVEMLGSPPADGKIYIGEADGLPYLQISDTIQSHTVYKDIVEPKL